MAVGTATGYGLDGRGFRARSPEGSRISLFHVIETDSVAHPAYYPMG
jgi:hypothetical protein